MNDMHGEAVFLRSKPSIEPIGRAWERIYPNGEPVIHVKRDDGTDKYYAEVDVILVRRD